MSVNLPKKTLNINSGALGSTDENVASSANISINHGDDYVNIKAHNSGGSTDVAIKFDDPDFETKLKDQYAEVRNLQRKSLENFITKALAEFDTQDIEMQDTINEIVNIINNQ